MNQYRMRIEVNIINYTIFIYIVCLCVVVKFKNIVIYLMNGLIE